MRRDSPVGTAPRIEPSEFSGKRSIVFGAAMGVGLGVSGLLTYSSGLFVHDLQRDIGLTRTAYGAIFFGVTLAIALAMPLAARAIERFGSRRAAITGSLFLALGFLLLGTTVTSVAAYAVIMCAIGLLAATSTPLAYSRAVSALFNSSRGLALGFVQLGVGLAAAIIPPLISVVIGAHGWRAGFLVLAGLAALGAIPALVGLPTHSNDPVASRSKGMPRELHRLFWLQLTAFSLMALSFAGMLAHFVPMLREAGLSVERAGTLAGLIGLSVIVTRLLVGWLADRMEASWLAAASCVLCAIGCLVLALGGPSVAPFGAIALGTAMGAEADLVSFMTARHFGVANFNRAYATQYAAFMLSAGLSPMWVGFLADQTGGYQLPLLVCAAGLLVPTALFMLLPRVHQRTRLSEPSETG